ncbi:MAG: hypothetical protein PF692_12615 [Kiritimatiellae bacterium]|jgi:hypothetical protein|nr:hypothetical protein [Kiritimatiellia bacterium]
MKSKKKPSLWWIALAPIIFIFGVGGGTALLLWRVIGLHEGQTFLVPSAQEFQITEPGTYILWHDYKITFDGIVYNKPESLPDQVSIQLRHEEKEVPMRTSWGASSTSGTHEKKEIGRYGITTPGKYTLSVNGLKEKRVFSFGRSEIKGLLLAALICLLLNLFGWLGAPALVAVVLVMRARRGKESANQISERTATSAAAQN